MRKYLALLLLLIAVPSYPWSLVGTVGAPAGASYLLQENFEGTGYDSGTWTETLGGATIDEDYTTAPLVGSQSLYVGGSTSNSSTKSPTFTGTNPCYMYFMVKFVQVNTSATTSNLAGMITAGNDCLLIQKNSKFYVTHGGTSAASTTVLGTTDTYHVWVEYTASTGANDGIVKVYVSTTATKPADPEINYTTGTITDNVTQCGFYNTSSTPGVIYVADKLRISASVIGSDPS